MCIRDRCLDLYGYRTSTYHRYPVRKSTRYGQLKLIDHFSPAAPPESTTVRPRQRARVLSHAPTTTFHSSTLPLFIPSTLLPLSLGARVYPPSSLSTTYEKPVWVLVHVCTSTVFGSFWISWIFFRSAPSLRSTSFSFPRV